MRGRPAVDRAVVVTYNRVNTDASALAALVARAGFAVDEPSDVGQLGQPIVIPVAPG